MTCSPNTSHLAHCRSMTYKIEDVENGEKREKKARRRRCVWQNIKKETTVHQTNDLISKVVFGIHRTVHEKWEC